MLFSKQRKSIFFKIIYKHWFRVLENDRYLKCRYWVGSSANIRNYWISIKLRNFNRNLTDESTQYLAMKKSKQYKS